MGYAKQVEWIDKQRLKRADAKNTTQIDHFNLTFPVGREQGVRTTGKQLVIISLLKRAHRPTWEIWLSHSPDFSESEFNNLASVW